jgi:hypothetical protein
MLRRVTLPPHIAGPLVVMLGAAQRLISALYNIIRVSLTISKLLIICESEKAYNKKSFPLNNIRFLKALCLNNICFINAALPH